jgi:serine protease Do
MMQILFQPKSIRHLRKHLAILSLAASALVPSSSGVAQEHGSARITTTVRAIEAAEKSVVNIEGNKVAKGGPVKGETNVNGMGAGVIIDPRGYILTNQHVVQDVKRIDVTLNDGTLLVGRLIARDADTDLAIIKVDSSRGLPVIPCGTSSDLMRGEKVVAIGNPFGYHHSVSEGIISALHRNIPVNGVQEYPDLIQTDASINPGNSGGPLLNADGQMIGINAAVRIGAQGIGFAIPVDRALEIAADLIAQTENQRGIAAEVKTEYRGGLTWVRVVQSASSELQRDDIIRKIGDRTIRNRLDYELALLGSTTGSTNLAIERNGDLLSSTITLQRENEIAGRMRLTASGTNSNKTSSTSTNLSVEERTYRDLGLKLEPADTATVKAANESYSGGMRIVSVRQNSPAHLASLQRGDILVGLVGWQTTSWEDIDYILKCKEMASSSNPEIRIIRGRNVYVNNLDLGTRSR